MPELPEVETTRRGLAPHLQGRRVHGVILRRADLRWPIPPEVAELLPGQSIEDIRRRAKYLVLDTAIGRMFPPDLAVLPTAVSLMGETLAIAVVRTAIGVLLALPWA